MKNRRKSEAGNKSSLFKLVAKYSSGVKQNLDIIIAFSHAIKGIYK